MTTTEARAALVQLEYGRRERVFVEQHLKALSAALDELAAYRETWGTPSAFKPFTDEMKDLRAENARLKEDNERLMSLNMVAVGTRDDALKDNAHLKTALEWIADMACGEHGDDTENCIADECGVALAREVLGRTGK